MSSVPLGARTEKTTVGIEAVLAKQVKVPFSNTKVRGENANKQEQVMLFSVLQARRFLLCLDLVVWLMNSGSHVGRVDEEE